MNRSIERSRIVAICVLLALVAGGLVIASKGLAAPTSKGNTVTIDNFSFTPAVLNVPVGTKVTWKNRDDIPHTVVDTNRRFKSQALDTDDSFTFEFTQPGTYDYFCSIHPKMTGKIVVAGKP